MIADKIFKFIKILFSVLCVFSGCYLYLGGFIPSDSAYIIRFTPLILILIGVSVALSFINIDHDVGGK